MNNPSKSSLKSDPLSVGYYYHFRKDLIVPYGPAFKANSFSDEHMNTTLRVNNSEFLTRPHLAMSMLSDTVVSNTNTIENTEVPQTKEHFLSKIKPLLPYFGVMSKNHESNVADGEKAVTKVTKWLSKDDEFLHEYLQKGLEYSSALYLTLVWVRFA